ncbi:hypothetical protein [Nocardia fusca]|uniref:Uncharacterized protein n=1 Tax=Nocardia fusca TaxID=941183 RepID=A0ABV3FHD1_9NOCA
MTCSGDVVLEPGWHAEVSIDLTVESQSAYLNTGNVTLTTHNDTNPTNNTAVYRVTNPDGGGIPGLPSGSSF